MLTARVTARPRPRLARGFSLPRPGSTKLRQRPISFWEEVEGREYGFWANVNPEVPHTRWSQATERVLGTDERVPTLLYNGYAEFVADLYANLQGERLFA